MKTSTHDRSAEFEVAVLESFKFLETDYAFLRRSSRPQKYTQLVIYENPELYVVLSYGPPAYEPEMSFGQRGIDDVQGGYSFHPGDLIQLDCCRDWTWKKDNVDALVGWVAELARLLEHCRIHCMRGNSLVFAQMRTRRDALIVDWLRDEKMKVLRAKIASAWRGKDYKQVLHLYKSIDDLTELDKKRMAFADANSK